MAALAEATVTQSVPEHPAHETPGRAEPPTAEQRLIAAIFGLTPGPKDTRSLLEERLAHELGDPDASLQELIEEAEGMGFGIDLYGAPWRSANTRYRCTLYYRQGRRTKGLITTAAETPWAAVAAAVVWAWDEIEADPR